MDWSTELLTLGVNLLLTLLAWRHYRRRVYSRRKLYLTFWPRFWAAGVDAAVLWPVGILLPLAASIFATVQVGAWLAIIEVIAWFAYSVMMHARNGQTCGKMVCGIRVVDHRTERSISVSQALRRDCIPAILYLACLTCAMIDSLSDRIGHILWGVLIGLPLLWYLVEVLTMLTNDKRRALHDWIAGTVVVRTNVRSSSEERLR